MAFVKMTNMLAEIEVPAGAVKAYESIGYMAIGFGDGTSTEVLSEDSQDETEKLSEEDKFVLQVEKKPLQQWNKDEVKQYAAINNIDITGTKNAQEAKERIKAFLDNVTE